MNFMRVVVVVQARMGSSRLPGKVLKKICNKTVLGHLLERIKQCKMIDEIIVATTTSESDNKIVEEALAYQTKIIRGSEEDVLSRYYLAAVETNAEIVVRITSDCPLFDPYLLESGLEKYLTLRYDIVRLGADGFFPRGFDLEIFHIRLLIEAYKNADKNYQREHVTPYIYENYSNILSIESEEKLSMYRVTLDTIEDFQVINAIYNEFYRGKHDFYFQDIVKFLKLNPEVASINAHIEQKRIK